MECATNLGQIEDTFSKSPLMEMTLYRRAYIGEHYGLYGPSYKLDRMKRWALMEVCVCVCVFCLLIADFTMLFNIGDPTSQNFFWMVIWMVHRGRPSQIWMNMIVMLLSSVARLLHTTQNNFLQFTRTRRTLTFIHSSGNVYTLRWPSMSPL